MPDLLTALPPDLLALLLRRGRRTGGTDANPLGGAVTFPTQRLTFRVRIAVGPGGAGPPRPADLSADPESWNWIDITRYVRFSAGIRLRTGKVRLQDFVIPASMELRLDNGARPALLYPGDPYPDAGRFTRRNPSSPLFGQLSRNTPIWVEVNAGSGYRTLAKAFISEWPTRWGDMSGRESSVAIECGGILRRLQQGSAARSCLRRAVLGANPVAAYMLEESSDARVAASAVAGAPSVGGEGATFGAAGPDGALNAVDFSSGGSVSVPVQHGTAPWAVCAAVKSAAGSSSETVMRVKIGSGTAYDYAIVGAQFAGIAGFSLTGRKVAGGTAGANAAEVDTARWHLLALVGRESPAGLARLELYVDGTLSASLAPLSGTIGRVTEVTLNRYFPGAFSALVNLPGSICGLAVFANLPESINFVGNVVARPPELYDPMNGFSGETAPARIVRVCAEEGIPLVHRGPVTDRPTMGPQPAEDVVDVLSQAEAVDGGVLYEDGFGLGYRGRYEYENAPILLTLDFAAGQVVGLPAPDDYDLATRNQWTASRSGGSEITYELADGPMGVGSDGPGVYDDSTTVNVESDPDLVPAASWRVLRDTVDEDRWAAVPLSFTRNPDLIGTFMDLPYGARAVLTNPPAELPPQDIDIVIEGVEQQVFPDDWTATLIATSNTPNHAFELAADTGDMNEFLGYLVPDTWTLTQSLDTSSVSFQANSDPLFSTDADDWTPGPLIVINGEHMRLTGVSGSSTPQTFTVTRSVNGAVKSHAANSSIEFLDPGVLTL